MIRIVVRRVENGYLLKFYRGFWEIFCGRYIAKNYDEIISLIQIKIKELEVVDDF